MSEAADQVFDQARFAAREFVARLERDLGSKRSDLVSDRMLFAFEMGFLRGRAEGMQAAMKMFDEIDRARAQGAAKEEK